MPAPYQYSLPLDLYALRGGTVSSHGRRPERTPFSDVRKRGGLGRILILRPLRHALLFFASLSLGITVRFASDPRTHGRQVFQKNRKPRLILNLLDS